MSTMSGLGLFTIAFLIFVLLTLLMGVRQVPQGYAYTVERFGNTTKLLRQASA